MIKGIPRNRLSPQELNQGHLSGGGYIWGGALPESSPSVSPASFLLSWFSSSSQ